MKSIENSCGQRLKRARVLAGIATRREFEIKYKISSNTLQGWEQDKNPLTQKGAKRLVQAFKNEGLLCTIEWLMHGTGMPPRLLEMTNPALTSDNFNISETMLHEEEKIYEESQLFKKNNTNTIVMSIGDNAMEPYFYVGDYVGGIRIANQDINKYLGNFCVVELENNLILPRILHAGTQAGTYVLSCTNPKTNTPPLNFYNVKILSAAPILWHRKKLCHLKVDDERKELV